MENIIKEGIEHIISITVTAADTAACYGSGLIEVFATPAMVALMENTAQSSIANLLPQGSITLGIEINVKHHKATPVGMKVSCKSVLTRIEGKKLWFSITAWDEKAEIGTATHIRYIVDAKKFMERLKD
jgi:fluoroacetyl-CoA thioesterase